MSAEAGDECPGRSEEGGVTVDRAEPVGRRHDLGVPRGIAAREEHGEVDVTGRERRELCRHEGPSDRVPEQDPETRHGLGRWEPTFLEQSEEAAFQLRDTYFGQMNSLKAFTGHLNGLLDEERMALIQTRDQELIEKSGKEEVKAAFAAIKAEMEKLMAKHGGERVNFQAMRKDMAASTEAVAEHKTVINKARFDVYGDQNYPDATFTLRLAYGTVQGYEAGTTKVSPKTTVHGLYERNAAFDNEHPFDLPQQWLDKKDELDMSTPYNFVSTCDIIGGNSGSPILDRDAKVVGLVFDGNIESLPGNYWFDEEVNRCVGVHSAIMVEALVKVYEEFGLVSELTGGK